MLYSSIVGYYNVNFADTEEEQLIYKVWYKRLVSVIALLGITAGMSCGFAQESGQSEAQPAVSSVTQSEQTESSESTSVPAENADVQQESEQETDKDIQNDVQADQEKENPPRQNIEWEQKDDKWYAVNADTGEMLKGPAWVRDENGALYYLQNDHTPAKGWMRVDGVWYYFGSAVQPQSGWHEIEGEWYYFDPETGEQVRGPQWIEANGKTYYITEEGMCAKGWKRIDGEWFYFGMAQRPRYGWYEIEGGWYYFDPETGRQVQGPRWLEQDGRKYYLLEDGRAATGQMEVDGEMYYFSTSAQKGWREIDGKWFYYEPETAQLHKGPGWLKMENGKKYYLTDEHYCATGRVQIDGDWYYLSTSARYGWYKFDDKWYYYDEDTSKLVHGPGWVTMPKTGSVYYLTAEDYAATGYTQVDGSWYYLTPKRQSGWHNVDSEWRYFNAETGKQEPKYGRIQIEGKWYFFDEKKGTQVHGPAWAEDSKGNTYYVTEDDTCASGLKKIDGESYYFEDKLVKGWFTDKEGVRRYSDPVTGVLNAQGGWFEIDGVKTYLLPEGKYVEPPTIESVTYEGSRGEKTVKIKAKASSLTNVNELQYSWDGGKSWTKESTRAFAAGTVLAAGTLQVKDSVGNITVYGGELELKKDGPYHGIDVSVYQGVIDWAAVKESGVDFAIIRALTWSNTVGYYVIDPNFEYNVREAKANGIAVGAYLFSYAFNVNEIYEEVDFFHNSKEMKSLRADDIRFDYPVYIDFEWNRILEKTNYDQRTDMLEKGMDRLRSYGYYPGFYSNRNWLMNYYDGKALVNKGYDFWYARYPLAPDLDAGTKDDIGFEAPIWQYASDGRVPGISGDVDMNISYVDYESLINAGGSSGEGAELTLTVYDLNTSRQVTGSVTDILAQIVMNEVGQWNNSEVNKAQAVAAYSWIQYQQKHGNPIPAVGLKTPSAAVKRDVESVAGKTLYYDNAPINAAYGSASGAYTNTAKNMWNLNLPYLNTPVESPEKEWQGKVKEMSADAMRKNLAKMVPAAQLDSTSHDQWLSNPVFDKNGYLVTIDVCGKTISGGTFYERSWGLYSPKFTYEYNSSKDTWTFTTYGNGHCVGMSQWGAYTYAKQGWGYEKILAHYYPNTTLK